jgi:hypothetical protein
MKPMPGVTFILVPGSGGSAWYWHRVVPILEQRGHEAIPVALPAADDTAGLPEYATTVVRAIGDRDPRHVVLVAQSLAAFTAPLVCEQVPVALLRTIAGVRGQCHDGYVAGALSADSTAASPCCSGAAFASGTS